MTKNCNKRHAFPVNNTLIAFTLCSTPQKVHAEPVKTQRNDESQTDSGGNGAADKSEHLLPAPYTLPALVSFYTLPKQPGLLVLCAFSIFSFMYSKDTHTHNELNMTMIVGLCWLNSNYTDFAGVHMCV